MPERPCQGAELQAGLWSAEEAGVSVSLSASTACGQWRVPPETPTRGTGAWVSADEQRGGRDGGCRVEVRAELA